MRLSISMTRNETLYGWLYLFIQLFLLPSALVLCNQLLPAPLPDAVLNFVLFSLNLVFILAIFHRFLLSSLRYSLRAPFRCLRAAFLGLAIYYIGNYLVSIFIQRVYPGFANVNDANIITMTQEHYTLMAVGTVCLVPPVEETLYRGLIFRGLHDKSRIAAYTVSTLVFCIIHVMGYIGTYDLGLLALCFVQYVPAGLTLAWVYERADSILAPILMHMTINQIGIFSMR